MNIKQANQMLDQIKKSGLHTKTKVAQELVRELEQYIKSAGMKKQADLRLYLQSDGELKKIFFYWASAALSQMSGEPELQGMTIPPVGSDTPTEYGTKILNQLPRQRGRGLDSIRDRMRRRQASVARYANFLNNLYEQLKPALTKSINSTYGAFVNNNKEFTRLSNDILEDLWQRATMWAITGKRDNAVRDTDVTPWKRVTENVKGGSSIAERVMGAIRKGVFSGMASKGRYLTLQERRELGIAEVDGENIRNESTEGLSSSGEEYSRLDQLSAEGHIENNLGKDNTEKYIEEKGLSEEDLDRIEGLLTDGSLDNQPLKWLTGLEMLLLSDHISNDDALISDTLKPDFFSGKYNSVESNTLARKLLERTGNPISDELEELIRSYHSGELNELDRLDAEYDLVNDGWMIDNIEVSVDAEEAVQMIEDQANQMANVAISGLSLPEGKLGELIAELAKVNLTLEHMKKLSKMFSEDGFSWMLDANLYLNDTEWALALRESDPKALRAIQDTIEEHQEPLLPLGLKHIFNSAVFADKAKVVAIKEFADNCMDQAVVKTFLGGNKGTLGWYLELALVLNGGSFSVDAGGKSHKIEVGKLSFFKVTNSVYKGLVNALMVASDAEVAKITKGLEDLIAPYRPNGLDYKMSDFLKNILTIANNPKYKSIPAKAGQAHKTVTNSGGKLKGFYSGIASELVRYRFYLDIGMTEGTNLPKGLGNADCDNRVRYLVGPIPTKELNEVKSEAYDQFILPNWSNEVQSALKAREEFFIKKKLTARNAVTKVFQEFGIEEGTELYEAFVHLDS
jgi:hypothetical protein